MVHIGVLWHYSLHFCIPGRGESFSLWSMYAAQWAHVAISGYFRALEGSRCSSPHLGIVALQLHKEKFMQNLNETNLSIFGCTYHASIRTS